MIIRSVSEVRASSSMVWDGRPSRTCGVAKIRESPKRVAINSSRCLTRSEMSFRFESSSRKSDVRNDSSRTWSNVTFPFERRAIAAAYLTIRSEESEKSTGAKILPILNSESLSDLRSAEPNSLAVIADQSCSIETFIIVRSFQRVALVTTQGSEVPRDAKHADCPLFPFFALSRGDLHLRRSSTREQLFRTRSRQIPMGFSMRAAWKIWPSHRER